MGLFPQTFIDDLRMQANILQVVQEYVPLKRAGTTYKGLCPFHCEKTPSFHVDPTRGSSTASAAASAATCSSFSSCTRRSAFQDAVRMLAQKFGVALPETEAGRRAARRDAALREALLKVHEIAAAYFREQLAAPAGARRARSSSNERGVTAADHRAARPRLRAARRATG